MIFRECLKVNNFSDIYKKYKLFIFDIDGVIWNKSHFIPYSCETLQHLYSRNKIIRYLTNNCSRPRSYFVKKFQSNYNNNKLKEYVINSDFYTSGYLTAKHIKENYSHLKNIFIIGSKSLVNEFEDLNFNVYSSLDIDNDKCIYESINKALSYNELDVLIKINESLEAVIVGFDYKCNFYKLNYAQRVVLNSKNKLLFGANIDSYDFEGINGSRIGTYPFVKLLEYSTDTKAEIVTKPDPRSLDIILNDIELSTKNIINKNEVLMIGDNLQTDIKFANNSGIDSVLVLTGVTKSEYILEKLGNGKNSIIKNSHKNEYGIPTYICNDIRI